MKLKQLTLLSVLSIVLSFCTNKELPDLAKFNVSWNSQSINSWGSMPVGNGDIGSNVWVTPDGVLHFYISKTDAFSENGRLLKVGKASVRFTPNVLAGKNFKQELDLYTGTIIITTDQVNLQFLIDANNPGILITGESNEPIEMEVNYDGWRIQPRELSETEMHSARGLIGAPNPVVVEPDTVLENNNAILWCHHNKRSIWKMVLEGQDLKKLTNECSDPLLNRTFGAYIFGENLITKSAEKLVSQNPSRLFALNIVVSTQISPDIFSWKSQIERLRKEIEEKPVAKRIAGHTKWWNRFWDKHYIFIDSEKDTENTFNVTRAYQLQRYMNACAGRGIMPIKFNGSIFNVDVAGDLLWGGENLKGFDADYRNWGGCYWWQNTRLPYWSMLYSGDFEMMQPLFNMYMDALDLMKLATQEYFNHNGAFFPETMYFWGSYSLTDYGWERENLPKGITKNQYIRYYWQSGLELVLMMQEYYLFTADERFLNDYLAVFAQEILTFYDEHYSKNRHGEIVFSPAHSLETYFQEVINPLPEIAGLKSITGRFLSDTTIEANKELNALCRKINLALPEIPFWTDEKGNELIAPAHILNWEKSNSENPELYAVFPYQHFGLKREKLEVARKTFEERKHKRIQGWQQDAIQAALLGLSDEAKNMVVENFKSKHAGSRFPAFWGPNYDWIPDQDHGSVNARALQNMLVQEVGDTILLLPSWPKEWDVEFKIHASRNTTIEGQLKNGEIEKLKVSPAARKKDIVFMNQVSNLKQ